MEDLVIRTAIISGEDVAGNAASKPDAIGARKGRKTKNASKPAVKEQQVIPERSPRITRSRYRSSQSQSINSTGEAQAGSSKQSNGNVVSKVSDTCWEKESSLLGKESYMDESTNEIACICKRTKCWQCLPAEIMKSGLLIYFINIKWEYARRKLLARILTGIGKCLGYHDQTHEIQKVVWQSISVLVSRNAYTQTCCSDRGSFLLDLIGSEIIGDTFAVESAAILYSIGWITVKSFHSKVTRIVCCGLSKVQLSKIMHWLKLAFVLGREVPLLFEKVSRLLSATNEHFTLPSCKALYGSHWASYFHQASFGTHLNNQFFPNTSGRSNAQHFVDSGPVRFERFSGSCRFTNSGSTVTLHNVMRKCLALESHSEFGVSFIFYYDSSNIDYALANSVSLDLHATGSSCPHTETSTLLRLAPESVHDLEQFMMNFYAGLPSTAIICISKKWHCPWGSTVVDNVAPAFKVILEENYVTSSGCPLEDIKSTSNLEDSWLGPWRHELLGDCLECENLNTVHKKLVRNLKSKCKVDINESYLKLVLGAAKFYIEEVCLSKRLVNELHWEDTISREPIILILDLDVQMPPWESIPILRQQEVYRMSSGGSISMILERCRRYDELLSRNAATVPLIDPLDAFYLLNPNSDLRSTQAEFENWFSDQKFEGKAGTVPTSDELVTALKSHDLHLYFGHGSGVSLSYIQAGSPVTIANLWEVTDKDIDRFGKAVLNVWLTERMDVAEGCSQCNQLVKEFDAMKLRGGARKGKSKKKGASSNLVGTANNSSASVVCEHRATIGSFVGKARDRCTLPFLNGAAPVCYGVPTGIIRKRPL
ncbi:putative Kinetochore protein ndc80 [Hibiscus syriacus]|uniref:separase n=1 Tax=Hibiscus syriacus TaxID=106335 RepID=A0A6A3CIF2_HIBSY|nr:putative Kinetochore protein ndc80 [Hibiscus syriacus]